MNTSSENPFEAPKVYESIPVKPPDPKTRTWWPYPVIIVLSLLSLIPPFIYIGLPSAIIAFVVVNALWKKNGDLPPDSNSEESALENQKKFHRFALLMVPGSIVAGIAVFGGTCTPVAYSFLIFDRSQDIGYAISKCLGWGTAVGVTAGVASIVYMCRQIYSHRPR